MLLSPQRPAGSRAECRLGDKSLQSRIEAWIFGIYRSLVEPLPGECSRRQSSTSSRVQVPTPVGAAPAGPGPGSRRTRISVRASRASGCQPGALGPRWVEADAWNPLAVVRSFAPEWIEGSPFQRTWPPRRTEAIAGAAGPHFCCARYCDCAAWAVRRFSRRVQGEKGVPIMRPGRHCHA